MAKGNIEVHWEVPGRLIRTSRIPCKEVFTDLEEHKAKARYKELKQQPFTYNIRMMRVERYCEQSEA